MPHRIYVNNTFNFIELPDINIRLTSIMSKLIVIETKAVSIAESYQPEVGIIHFVFVCLTVLAC